MYSWPQIYIPKIAARFHFPQLNLHNTSTSTVQTLPKKPRYRMYVCGITPYDATHLGHAATYLTFDLIHRYLLATGSTVDFVQNITDIDDPLLERAHRDGVRWQSLAQSQIDLFRSDMTDLHIIPPQNFIGVVEAMPLVVAAVQKLVDADSTYAVDSDLYYRTKNDPQFGTLSKYSNDKMVEIFKERGGDPQRVGKENPLDALIWLSQRKDEPGWDSPFGVGRPGWHIECSAIALHYLKSDDRDGFSIDIQGGGSDLIFPHHEMSASQSWTMTSQKFAQFYIHAGMIGLDGQKMSKSLGNLVFVSTLISQGVRPVAIRWALMGHRYSTDVIWDKTLMEGAAIEVEELQLALARMEVAPTNRVISEIIKALSNDLDTPEVLQIIRGWVCETKLGSIGGEAGELSRALDSLLGLAL